MKNEKIFTVVVTEDYNENQGNPVNQGSESFDNESNARSDFENELKEIVKQPGLTRRVELWVGDSENPLNDILADDCCPSAELPKDGVIVYYQHNQYMNYSYNIIDVVKVSDSGKSNYDDLPYSVDHTYKTWADVYDSMDELVSYYENGHGIFEKINKGVSKIESFFEDNKVEGYFEEETEE